MGFETRIVPVGFLLRFEKEKDNLFQVFAYGVFSLGRGNFRLFCGEEGGVVCTFYLGFGKYLHNK